MMGSILFLFEFVKLSTSSSRCQHRSIRSRIRPISTKSALETCVMKQQHPFSLESTDALIQSLPSNAITFFLQGSSVNDRRQGILQSEKLLQVLS
jgi:hypothetical protein